MKLFVYVLGKKILGIFSENFFVSGKKETATTENNVVSPNFLV